MFSFELPQENLMNFIVAIISLATMVKFMMYIRQLNKVKEIEKVLVKLDKRVDTEEELKIHKSMTKELSLVSKMFILAYTANAVIAESSFLFQDKRTLPFPTWFPLDWKNSMLYYLLALLYQFLSITAQISQNFVDDLFPPLVLCLIARNCEMLIHRISLIGYDQSDQRTNEQRLYSCIRDQQQLYRLLDLSMEIFSAPMLLQFIVIAIDLGAAMCEIVLYGDSQLDRLYYRTLTIGLFLQIFPICYYGTLVEHVFGRLHYAVFTSNWVDQSIVYRRTAITFAFRTQKVPQLMAGNVIPISLTTFLANCKAAYSFFTLIADTGKESN
ncbi:odorant receptor 23a-like [Drosophila innubila]|uniref:odorant receptor 23a-like n=1 Tax=Drosophila innubila TaxID=198719 RepID=UPI00148CA151|nr:odorant receptor 23a-like [Drosophila innubila]